MHCNVKTRCEALKALAQKKLGTDDPAVVEITRGGKNRSHHVLRRSDMKKVGLIAGGAFIALTALNVYSHYKLHQKIADRKLKKQLAPLNAQLDELRTENEALRQALAELKPRPLRSPRPPRKPKPPSRRPEPRKTRILHCRVRALFLLLFGQLADICGHGGDGFVVLQAPAGLGGKVGEGAEGRLDQRDGIIGDDHIRRIEYLYSRVLADAQGQAGREIAFWLFKIPPDAERRQKLQQLRFLLRVIHKDTVIAETVYGNSQTAIFRQHDLPRPEPAEQAQPHHQEDSKQDHKLFGAHGGSHPFSGHAGREARYCAVYRTFSSEQTV